MALWTSLALLSALAVSALSLPQPDESAYKIPQVGTGRRSQYYVLHKDGTFKYGYDTGEGAFERARSPRVGKVDGDFGYTDPDGNNVYLQYQADEAGFVAKGDHIPAPHPDFAAAHAAARARPPFVDPLADPTADASYGFQFAEGGQARAEQSDSDGNVRGSYTYTDEEGRTRTYTYTAGRGTGFVIEGDDLPQAPEAPGATPAATRLSSSAGRFSASSATGTTSSTRPSQTSAAPSTTFRASAASRPSSTPFSATPGSPVGTGGPSSRPFGATPGSPAGTGRPSSSSFSATPGSPAGAGRPSSSSFSATPGSPAGTGRPSSSSFSATPGSPAGAGRPSSTAFGATPGSPAGAVSYQRSGAQSDASYSFAYDAGDHSRSESADADLNVEGQFSFVADDGVTRKVTYEAGSDTGFLAEGDHLPQAPQSSVGSQTTTFRASAASRPSSTPFSATPGSPAGTGRPSSTPFSATLGSPVGIGGPSSRPFGATPGSPAGAGRPSSTPFGATPGSPAGTRRPSSTPFGATPGSPAGAVSYQRSGAQSDASYSFAYDAGDHSRSESADADLNVEGQFSFVADDGVTRKVTYEAGSDTGFLAEGDHLPQAPQSSVGSQTTSPSSSRPQTSFRSPAAARTPSFPGTPAGSPTPSYRGTPAGARPSSFPGTPAGSPTSSFPGTPAGASPSSFSGTPAGSPTPSFSGTPAGARPSSFSGTPAGARPSSFSGTPAGVRPSSFSGTPAGAPTPSFPGTPAGASPSSFSSRPLTRQQTQPFEPANTRSQLSPDSSYSFAYETSSHSRAESGDKDNNVVGDFDFVADDGQRRAIQYEASSATGFIAEGAHIPVGPKVPGAPSGQPTGRIVPVQEVPFIDPLADSSADASYDFAFDSEQYSRTETADADGNVQGTYTVVDDDGTRRTYRFRAGEGVGFETQQVSSSRGPPPSRPASATFRGAASTGQAAAPSSPGARPSSGPASATFRGVASPGQAATSSTTFSSQTGAAFATSAASSAFSTASADSRLDASSNIKLHQYGASENCDKSGYVLTFD